MWFAERRAIAPVLGFWFAGDADHADARLRQWLDHDPALRAPLQEWAPPLVELAGSGALDHINGRPLGSLALILLLDATPRVLWPGTERAYATDLAAQGHVLHALATRQDGSLDVRQRLMLYLPLMHSENLALQDRSVEEYARLLIGANTAERELVQKFLDVATESRETVWRFGRFPDRNATLHRINRLEEKWYLHDTHRPWFAPQPKEGEVPDPTEPRLHIDAQEADQEHVTR